MPNWFAVPNPFGFIVASPQWDLLYGWQTSSLLGLTTGPLAAAAVLLS